MASTSTLRCTIVTPSDAVFDGDVTYVSMPAWDGQQGVMPGQSPVLTRLGIGTLRLDAGNSSHWFMVDGGFAQISGDELTIITERALRSDQIDAGDSRAELTTANEDAVGHGSDQAVVEADQARARAKIAAASH